MTYAGLMAMVAALTIASPMTSPMASVLGAQAIASRVGGVRNGLVQFAFATRPGVCGDGRGSVWTRPRSGRYGIGHDGECVAGPVRVILGKSEGDVVSVRSCVACLPRTASSTEVDLGMVDAADAARYLIRLSNTLAGANASEAISAAAFADSVDVSPELSALIRNEDATIAARKDGLFWLGQSDVPTSALVKLYAALKPFALREHYTFVISQRRDDDAALEKLMDIARHDSDFQVRKQAMFWLGQSSDPRAIKFFHTILMR